MAEHTSFLQTPAWEQVQQRLGRTTYWLDGTLFIKHPLRFGMHYWYAPRAASIPTIDRIDAAFKKQGLFVKVEPTAGELAAPWIQTKTRQPRQTLLLDLTKSTDSLLAQMKPKTRYNIRLAERKKVTVYSWNYPESKQYLPYYLSHTKDTNARDQISSHEDSYYQAVLEELGKNGMASLLVAFVDKTPVASIIMVRHDGVATYLFGASSNQSRESMATYLIQWEAIKLAKAAGDTVYDFWGVRIDQRMAHGTAGSDLRQSNIQPTPGKSFGVTRFKLGFGGSIHLYPPAYDRSYSSFWYNIYRGASSLSSSSSFSY